MSERNAIKSVPEVDQQVSDWPKDWIVSLNSAPIQSLLYDLDLLPEQLEPNTERWTKMLNVIQHMKLAAAPTETARQQQLIAVDAAATAQAAPTICANPVECQETKRQLAASAEPVELPTTPALSDAKVREIAEKWAKRYPNIKISVAGTIISAIRAALQEPQK
jgi:hypothetical protein